MCSVVAVGGIVSLCAGPFKVPEVLRGLNILFFCFLFFFLLPFIGGRER